MKAENEYQKEADVHREAWREAARQPCDHALEDALVAYDSLVDAIERLGDQSSVWSWLTKARDLHGPPTGNRASSVPMREVRKALEALAPTTTEERWAEEEARQRQLHEELQAERSKRRVSLRT